MEKEAPKRKRTSSEDNKVQTKRQSRMQQGRAMDVHGLEAMLEHAGLLSGVLKPQSVRSVVRGLQVVIEIDDDDSDTDSDASENDRPAQYLNSAHTSTECTADLQPVCFQEFIDFLVAIVLYKDRNPFVPFMQRFEHLIVKGLLWPLRTFWLEKDQEANIGKMLDAGLHEEEASKKPVLPMRP